MTLLASDFIDRAKGSRPGKSAYSAIFALYGMVYCRPNEERHRRGQAPYTPGFLLTDAIPDDLPNGTCPETAFRAS